jgi:SAM-dependent methyltransferase
MPQTVDDRQFLEEQYKDSSNLDVRIRLHQRFSTNKYGWHPWIFDHIDLPPSASVLELGCGPGDLWLENSSRIPAGWEIILSDFSPGMLEQARKNLGNHRLFRFRVIDARSIPCEDHSFDAVIANHMLYHVPDRPVALAEICRVLKPAGRFYASTIGARHLVEIRDLLVKFDPALASWGRVADSFTLENGMAQFSPWFTDVRMYRFDDALEVTEPIPLVDYILSGWAGQILDERRTAFSQFVDRSMAAQGDAFHITKDSGLFTSFRGGA